MPAFVEERFNTEIRYGAVGGPEFNTDVIVVDSGHEFRNSNWADARGKWQLGSDLYTRAEIDVLSAFFRARKGRAEGFRFKDWSDFFCTVTNGRFDKAAADGSPTYQLYKRYETAGGAIYNRKITKPVSGTVEVFVGGSLVAATVSTITGVVTMPEISSANILAITQAVNAEVTTTAAHGLTTGNKLYLSGIVGMIQLNGVIVTIIVTDVDKFTIGINTTTYGAYSSGGTAKQYLSTGALTWAGDFDVPVRFDTDKFECEFAGYRDNDRESLFQVSGLPIIEVRV